MNSDVEPCEHERLMFRVRSRTDQRLDPYVVDLAAHDERGQCDCKSWQCRHQHEGQCKHVARASAVVVEAVLAAARRYPSFGMELHRVVRLEWEIAVEKSVEPNK